MPNPTWKATAVAAAALSIVGSGSVARAETVCSTVDEFNALMAGAPEAVTTVNVKFDVTGVNPPDFFGSKGCLIDLHNSSCETGSSATLKVYGPDDPPNTSHPAGTLKFEYGNTCCPNPPCSGEGWASPNPSEVVFVNGSEQCQVETWLDPATIGYKLVCNGTTYEAVGDNTDGLRVNQVVLFSLVDGGWKMDNVVSNTNEICYEAPPVDSNGPKTIQVPAIEDVTASIGWPASVYPDLADLSVGASDSELFLKFDLSQVPGQVQRAQIFLHKSDVQSAEGDGGDAYAVQDSSWSETTLTWDARPATTGPSLARQSPIEVFGWYAWDVSAAVTTGGIYSFAIKPQPSDQNGAHFFSKEGNGSLAPYLLVDYVVVDADGDGHPAGPDCDDTDAAVFPGAAEVCNGVDDDCDGQADQDCDGAESSGSGTSGGDSDGGNPIDEDGAADSGCGCRVLGGATGRDQPLLLLGVVAALVAVRKRRRFLSSPR